MSWSCHLLPFAPSNKMGLSVSSHRCATPRVGFAKPEKEEKTEINTVQADPADLVGKASPKLFSSETDPVADDYYQLICYFPGRLESN